MTGEVSEPGRPRLRGWLHLVAAVLSVGGLIWLVRSASSGSAVAAAWIYGLACLALYSTSATYHVFARSPRVRRVMQSLDHSMIYVLIAGTFTPICLLGMTGPWRFLLLGIVWAGAVLGVLLSLTALDRYRKLVFALYLVLGWAGIAAFPALIGEPSRLVMSVVAGVLYTVGAVLFALRRPRLRPAWFGYHELWHTFGVAAGGLFFAVNLGLVRATGA